jgi:hypothetical protein
MEAKPQNNFDIFFANWAEARAPLLIKWLGLAEKTC